MFNLFIVFIFLTLTSGSYCDPEYQTIPTPKYPILYTNFGKDRIRSCHLSTNKTFMFNRSASIPIKVSQNAARVVTLNRDGSISWYNKDLSQVLEDWYLTRDGQWYAF